MIRIRPLFESDEEVVLSWCESEDTFYKWTAGVLGEYPITADKLHKTANMMRFCALDEDEPVGFFTMRIPGDNPNELRIGFVIVQPQRRGNGVGKAMMKRALRFAFDVYQAQRVVLVVFEDNAQAKACYTSIGFTQTGKRETYHINGKDRDCIELELCNPAFPNQD